MFMNSYKFLFFCSMMMGSLIAISATSWFSIWMGLEINLLSFIPLMMSSKNLFSSESTLKYFLTQALASSIFLFTIILFYLIFKKSPNFLIIYSILISSTLLLKSGAAPFHFWFPSVMEGLTWMNNLILMTWQKIAPLMILSYCMNLNLLNYIIILSILFGSIGGLNQTSLRKLMSFSSINHLGWMLAGMMYSEMIWLIYFWFYFFLTTNMTLLFNNFKFFNINQTFSKFYPNQFIKIFLFLTLLSLGGLPPFLGFFPKWIIMESMIFTHSFFVLMFMLFFTLITLYFYLRISYSALLMNHTNMNWNFKVFYQKKKLYFLIILSLISIMGLILINVVTFIL